MIHDDVEYDGDGEDSGTKVCGLYYAKCKTARTIEMKKGVGRWNQGALFVSAFGM